MNQSNSPSSSWSVRALWTGVVLLILAVVVLTQWFWLTRTGPSNPPGVGVGFELIAGNAAFVGAERCAACHETEFDLWRGSHHDLAMQVASESTVLGDFDDATFTHHGVTTRFFRDGEKFMVETENARGEMQTYEVRYTFGITPLQQYIVPVGNGRYQVLTVNWDTRPAEEGGQRWFHLYPEEFIPPGDELHWTGGNFNWNFACAECHSTDLRKQYDPETRVYTTEWSEINVSCEACHGPGSEHLRWATLAGVKPVPLESYADSPFADLNAKQMGLTVQLKEDEPGYWEIDRDTGIPRRNRPLDSAIQAETCAACHSRRLQIAENGVPGETFMDAFAPSVIEPPLYHNDGQIRDEVYVYGSFRQSKMYHAGVRCTDCHDPHALTLRLPGDQTCYQCHEPGRYAVESHHHHPIGSPGASCLECHMPATHYMVVDPRRDHSFRIPRPDLAALSGAPDACTSCHTDRDVAWSVEKWREWYGEPTPGHYDALAEALTLAPRRNADAMRRLEAIARDPQQPAIFRASAVRGVAGFGDPASGPRHRELLDHPDPLVRREAVQLWSNADPRQRLVALGPMLDDPVRSVRTEAARLLAGVPVDQLDPPAAEALTRALDEYIETQRFNADRGSARHNLGVLAQERGNPDEAIALYQAAIEVEPSFVPAYVNLADLHRRAGREDESIEVIEQGLAATNAATLHHAKGLWMVRQGRLREAVDSLALAFERGPDSPAIAHVYAVALKSAGRRDDALRIIEQALRDHPYDTQLLTTGTLYLREAGRYDKALQLARYLNQLHPDQPAIANLVAELEAQASQE